MSNGWVAGALVVALSLVSVFAFWWSLRQTAETHARGDVDKKMRKLRGSTQTRVTVLIESSGDKLIDDRTLASVLRSRYHNFDARIVGVKGDRNTALKKAYRQSRQGEVVVLAYGGMVFAPDSVKRLVASRPEGVDSWSVPVFEFILPSSDRLGSVLMAIIDSLLITTAREHQRIWAYASNHFLKNIGGVARLGVYESTRAVSVILFSIIILTSILTGDIMVIWYSWLIYTIYLIFVVVIDNSNLKRNRFGLLFAAPSAMFLLPVASVAGAVFQLITRK